MAVDCAAARLDYVSNPALTWTVERKAASEKLVEKSRERIAISQSEQLAACNSRHPEIAEKFDSAVNRLDFAANNTHAGLSGFYLLFDNEGSGNENDPDPLALRLPSGNYDVALLFDLMKTVKSSRPLRQ